MMLAVFVFAGVAMRLYTSPTQSMLHGAFLHGDHPRLCGASLSNASVIPNCNECKNEVAGFPDENYKYDIRH